MTRFAIVGKSILLSLSQLYRKRRKVDQELGGGEKTTKKEKKKDKSSGACQIEPTMHHCYSPYAHLP